MLNVLRTLSIACCMFALNVVEAQIVPIPAITDAIIAARTIDLTKPVGTTEGTHGVTPNGAATYSIPLVVPPGTNGMQPSLALVYNSYGGDGLLGIGWGVSGLSAIQRVGSDVYHDGVAAPIKYTSADHFALDGQRLVNTYSTYGAANAVYDTENAKYSYITPVGTFGSGPGGFKVITKDGMIYWYGFVDEASEGSLAVRSSGFETLGWLLSKVEDPFGNYMRFIYSNNSLFEAKRIVRIDYSMNDAQGITAFNAVEFYYNNRADKNVLFSAGSEVRNDFLLERIDIKAEGVLMKQYELKYAQRQQNVSYLSELIERGVGGLQLNSTIFKYGDLSAAQESQTPTTSVGQGEQGMDLFSGDFDGNGKSDILKASFTYSPQGYKRHNAFYIYLNGSTTATYSSTLSATQLAQIENLGGDQQFLFSDLDGDGREDIVVSYITYDNSYQKFKLEDIQVWRSTSQNNDAEFIQSSIGVPSVSTYRWLYPASPREFLIPGDYDGDGDTDLAAFVYDNLWNAAATYVWRYGSGWTQQNMGSAANHFGNGKRINVGDLDGDGKMDLVSRNDTYSDQCWVVTMSSANTWTTMFTSTVPRTDQTVFVGDFNGDGKHEFLIKTSLSAWYIVYSKGTAFTTAYSYTMSPTPTASDPVIVGDFNGDGKSDIFLGYYNSGTAQYRMSVAYSKGLLTTGPSFELKNFLSPTAITSLSMGDFNGDGKVDILNRHYYGDPARILQFNVKTHERRLDKVVNGMGYQVDFDYLFLTEPSVYGEDYEVFESPDADYDVPLPLVWKVKTSNGIGGTAIVTHTYRDAWGWRNGPGFIGFMKHTISDAASDRRVEESYAMSGQVAVMFMTESKTTDISTGTALSSTTVIGGASPIGGMRRYWLQTNMSTENDFLAGTQVVSDNFLWDNYGNVTRSRVNVAGKLLTETYSPTYGAYGPYPYSSKPASIQVTTTRTGSPAVTVTTGFLYSSTTGAVTRRTDYQDKPVPLITDYTYYGPGNLRQTTVSYAGLASNDRRITIWGYDPGSKYRYPTQFVKRWNNGGSLYDISEYYIRDPKFGGISVKTSADGLQTDFTYDAFGRMITESAPYVPGSPRYNITYQYTWDVQIPQNKYYYRQVLDPKAPDKKTWYDILGREVEVQTASFASGAWTKSNMTYDAVGRLSTSTLPKLTGETGQTDTYTYDPLGRPASWVNSVTGTTTYAYAYSGGELRTTITRPGNRVSWTTTNATGKVVKAHDDGGDLDYSYDSWGNLLTVGHNGVAMATNAYDVYGRQTQMVDADAGITQYLYNPFGELVWQKNAMNQITTFTYDNLGRLKTRVEPEGTSTWTYYFQSNKFNDNVVSAVSPQATMSYSYDAFGNRTFETQTTSHGPLYKRNYYDSYDRLAGIEVDQSPMQVQVGYSYTTEGFLNTVTLNGGTVLFQGLSVNGFGRYKQYVLADGKTTTVTYDQQFPTRIQADAVQDLNLVYDQSTGNLTSRWDKMKARKEVFTYDALDRLKTSRVDVVNSVGTPISAGPVYAYTYDGSVGTSTKGNLIQRTDVGKFNYSAAHAPTMAMGNAFPTPADAPPLGINQATQSITYGSFHQPLTIVEPISSNPFTLNYEYGADHYRSYCEISAPGNGSYIETRQYMGSLERQMFEAGITNMILYVPGGDGLCAMIVASNDGGYTQVPYAVYKDQLGSIVAVTKKVGSLVTIEGEQNFDAWGRPRHQTNWSYATGASVPQWLYRGYTGHEHVAPFGLINMNGRMYDPMTGRMLSADNYVNGDLRTQGFNRYAYASNNPLKYVDRNGEFIHIVIGAAVGGLINLGIKAYQGKIGSWKDGFAAFGIGAVAGAVGAATGGAAFAAAGGAAGGIGGFVAGAAGGAAGSAVATPINSIGNSLYFGDPPLTLKSYAISIVAGAALGGSVNGGIALAKGNSFWSGAAPRTAPTNMPGAVPQATEPTPTPAPAEPLAPPSNQPRPADVLPEESNFRIDYPTNQGGAPMPLDGKSLSIPPLPRPSINGYDPRLANQTDVYHNFPQVFDDIIIEHGFPATRLIDQAPWFELPGMINGTPGVYQLGINDMGIVFHRAFLPVP